MIKTFFGTKIYRIAAVVVLIAICTLAGALLYVRKTSGFVYVPHVQVDPAAEGARWEARIKEVGGKAAYEEFARAVANLSPAGQHVLAHAFGGALFAAEGEKSLTVCDTQFSYGCFHEFLGRAIASLGLSEVVKLNQVCFDQLKGDGLACQHGVGHGVLADLGYGDQALSKALGVCKNLPYSDPIGGCYGGVFMEYNMRTMLGADGKLREVYHNDMQHPCDTLSSAYWEACVFWETQWWHQTLKTQGMDEDAIYRELGSLCSWAEAHGLARTCFEGIGNNVPPSADFDPARSIEFCEETSSNSQYQLFCRSYAANSLSVGGAGKIGDGLAVCKGLPAASYRYCAAYARNQANIAVPAEPPLSL